MTFAEWAAENRRKAEDAAQARTRYIDAQLEAEAAYRNLKDTQEAFHNHHADRPGPTI